MLGSLRVPRLWCYRPAPWAAGVLTAVPVVPVPGPAGRASASGGAYHPASYVSDTLAQGLTLLAYVSAPPGSGQDLHFVNRREAEAA